MLVLNCLYIVVLFETLPTIMFCYGPYGIFYLMGQLVYNRSKSSFQSTLQIQPPLLY